MASESILQVLASNKAESESYLQLVTRLKNSGEIPEDKLKSIRLIASAADYYDNNAWLHVDKPFTDTSDMVRFLRENKSDDVSLSHLTTALWTAGKIPKEGLRSFRFTAGAADYYENNKWLHVKKPFADSLDMVSFLRKNRPDGNSLSYLASALWTGRKIPISNLKHFQMTSGAADYYDNNSWLHVKEPFTDPLEAIDFLRRNKPDDNSLSYLIQALWTGGKIPKDKLLNFQFAAGAAAYYDNNSWLHVKKPFTDPLVTIEFLKKNKPDNISLGYLTQALWTAGKIPKGKLAKFGYAATATTYYDNNSWLHVKNIFTDSLVMIEFLRKNKPDDVSLGYLTQALWTGGRIPCNKLANYRHTANAANYYNNNDWLHVKKPFTDPKEMISFLKGNKPGDVSLALLTQALWTGGKIPGNKQEIFQRIASSTDYYDNNIWLHVKKPFTNAHDMVNFIKANKPDNVSFSYLTQALWTGGKIPEDKLQTFEFIAGAAEYSLSRREMIEKQIIEALPKVRVPIGHRSFFSQLRSNMNTSLFTWRNDPSKTVSGDYLQVIIKCAMNFYGNEIIGVE